jgi:hypothetical protein
MRHGWRLWILKGWERRFADNEARPSGRPKMC